jgi:hypothetical protein
MSQSTPSRSFLDAQAALLAEPRVRAALEMLSSLGAFDAAPVSSLTTAQIPAGDDTVGIWRAERDAHGETSFVRRADLVDQWGFWANVHRIGPKQERRRVVLLGESAARGYLYDPHCNVAKALAAMLDAVFGSGVVEVVDLARLALGSAGLFALVNSTVALDPDLVVVFAGNNWRTGMVADLSHARRAAHAGALRDGGIAALKAQCERELVDDVRALLRQLSTTFLSRNVPVVVLVPEVNLADWTDRDVVPGWLGAGRTATWWARHDALMRARASDDRARAGSIVSELLELDQGTCARSRYLLAELQQASGRATAEVRRNLEEARDASIWNPRTLPSRTSRVMQEALRAEAPRLGVHVVDLPVELASHVDAPLPNRRLFLDNCHLSHEGIRVTAAVSAARLAPLLGAATVSPHELLRATPLPISSAAEASAHFAAAIINAHWGQNGDVLRFHCERALRSHSGIAGAVEDYIELAVRRAPGWVCAPLERLASRNERLALTSVVLGNLARQPKLMDRELLESMAALLGDSAEERLDELRCSEYGGDSVRTPLHEPYFALRGVGDHEADNLTRTVGGWTDVFRAYTPDSSFALVQERSRAVQLQLCARLDDGQPEGELIVYVNGIEVARTTVGTRWRTWDVKMPANAIRRGINDITVRWPREIVENGRMDRAVGQLERGIKPELYPVFGEVHSLWATNL